VPYFKPGKELKDLLNREPEPSAAQPATQPVQAPAAASPPLPEAPPPDGVI
jgi:hypothetical protein